jgi:hypothetical protein
VSCSTLPTSIGGGGRVALSAQGSMSLRRALHVETDMCMGFMDLGQALALLLRFLAAGSRRLRDEGV